MRSQGRATWRRFNAALSEGRAPAREVIDGALVIFGGALLLTPGFFTDVFGLLLLLPPSRVVIRRLLVRHFSARLVVSAAQAADPRTGGVFFQQHPTGNPRDPRYDVEGDATEVDPPRRELP